MTLESQQNQVDTKEISPSAVDVTDVKKLAQVLALKDQKLDTKELNDKLQQNKDKVFDGLVKSIDMSINENTNDVQFMKSLQNVVKYLKAVFVDPDSQYKLDAIDIGSKRLQSILWFEEVNKQTDPEKFAKVSALFETMIFNTPDKVIQDMIQNMANNDNLSAQLYKQTFVKLDSYLLNAKKVGYPFNFSFMPSAVVGYDSWTYASGARERDIIIESGENKQAFEKILANKTYETIVIKGNSKELSSFKEKFKDPRIKYVEDNNLTKISISSLEKKLTSHKIIENYLGLNANEILESSKIQETLSKNPKVKEMIESNSQLTNLKIGGSASLSNNVGYVVPSKYTPYMTADNIKYHNETQLKSNPNVLGNTELAKTRALSIVDFFYKNQKVAPNANFDISYKVDGSTKDEIKNNPDFKKNFELAKSKNPETILTEADYISSVFKQRQNVSLEMDFVKTEIVEKPLLTLNQRDTFSYKGLSLGVVTKQPSNTAGKPKPNPKNGPDIGEIVGDIGHGIGSGISTVGRGIGETAKDFGSFVGSIFEKRCRMCERQRKMWAR